LTAPFRDAKRVWAARKRLEEHARTTRQRVAGGGRRGRRTRALDTRDARPVVAVEGGAVVPATTSVTPQPPASQASAKVVSLRATEPRGQS